MISIFAKSTRLALLAAAMATACGETPPPTDPSAPALARPQHASARFGAGQPTEPRRSRAGAERTERRPSRRSMCGGRGTLRERHRDGRVQGQAPGRMRHQRVLLRDVIFATSAKRSSLGATATLGTHDDHDARRPLDHRHRHDDGLQSPRGTPDRGVHRHAWSVGCGAVVGARCRTLRSRPASRTRTSTEPRLPSARPRR